MVTISVGVFCTGKSRVFKIAHSSFEVVLRTTKHTVIYPGSCPSLEVIALYLVLNRCYKGVSREFEKFTG
jgi:hypothetical protein